MRSYAERQPTAAEYDQWMIQQVEVALAEIEAGVESEFEKLRAETRRSIDA